MPIASRTGKKQRHHYSRLNSSDAADGAANETPNHGTSSISMTTAGTTTTASSLGTQNHENFSPNGNIANANNAHLSHHHHQQQQQQQQHRIYLIVPSHDSVHHPNQESQHHLNSLKSHLPLLKSSVSSSSSSPRHQQQQQQHHISQRQIHVISVPEWNSWLKGRLGEVLFSEGSSTEGTSSSNPHRHSVQAGGGGVFDTPNTPATEDASFLREPYVVLGTIWKGSLKEFLRQDVETLFQSNSSSPPNHSCSSNNLSEAQLYNLYKTQSDCLDIFPNRLIFPQSVISAPRVTEKILITNRLDAPIAFKVKTTNPKAYCVSPKGKTLAAHASQVVEITKVSGISAGSVQRTRFRIEAALLSELQQKGSNGMERDFQKVFDKQRVISRQRLPCEMVDHLPADMKMEAQDGNYVIESIMMAPTSPSSGAHNNSLNHLERRKRHRSTSEHSSNSSTAGVLTNSTSFDAEQSRGESANGSAIVDQQSADDIRSSIKSEYSNILEKNNRSIRKLRDKNKRLSHDHQEMKQELEELQKRVKELQVEGVPSFVNTSTLLGLDLAHLSSSELGHLHSLLQTSVGKVFEEYTNRTRGENDVCVLCLEAERSVLFFPCKHLVACDSCVIQLMQQKSSSRGGTKCPICRCIVQDVVRNIHL